MPIGLLCWLTGFFLERLKKQLLAAVELRAGWLSVSLSQQEKIVHNAYVAFLYSLQKLMTSSVVRKLGLNLF